MIGVSKKKQKLKKFNIKPFENSNYPISVLKSEKDVTVVSNTGTASREINVNDESSSRVEYDNVGQEQSDLRIGPATSARVIEGNVAKKESNELSQNTGGQTDSQRILVIEKMEVSAVNMDLNDDDVTLSLREKSKEQIKSREGLR